MKTYLLIIVVLACPILGFGQQDQDTIRLTPNFSATKQQQDARNKAIELYEQENFAEAIPLFETVLTADRTDWDAWYHLGMCFAKTGKMKEALGCFRQGANFYPKDPESSNLGFKITSKPRADYPDGRQGTSGVISLAVEFKGDGKLGTIVPVKTMPGGFVESGIAATKRIKFTPMMRDGKPVITIRIVEYSFQTY